MPKSDKPVKNPAPRCGLCQKYASHGPRCGHVDCPCRKQVTAQITGSSYGESSTTRRFPSVRTTREYEE